MTTIETFIDNNTFDDIFDDRSAKRYKVDYGVILDDIVKDIVKDEKNEKKIELESITKCKEITDDNIVSILDCVRLLDVEDKLLYKIYSLAFSERDGRVCEQDVLKFWSPDDLLLAIPFYDSYVYYNNLTFENFIPDLVNSVA